MNGSKAVVPHKAYVVDEEDEYKGTITIVDPPPPEVPSPPSATPSFQNGHAEPVNVFDFFVGSETPNQSTLNLAAMEQQRMLEDAPEEPQNEDTAMVRFQDDYLVGQNNDDDLLVEYGTGPVPTSEYRTPAPKADRERKKKDHRDHGTSKDEKKDKKRKRLHVDTSQDLSLSRGEGDEIMTDAPPVLHSGLTGGLNRLLSRPSVFPPSPDYSGGDAGDASPGSPLKRSKHSKHSREGGGRVDMFSNSIMALISTRKHKDSDHDRRRHSKRHHRRRGSESVRTSSQKMIEYKPMNGDGAESDARNNQMVVYQARAELLMSFVNKGPESERGCSMNKTLKRYHRERAAMGMGLGKSEEEKKLWRSLRLKRNDRGEIVLFCA
jgi:cell growth-regulating nucleolar protein